MTFRKNCLLFIEGQILCTFMIASCLATIPVLGFWFSLVLMIPFIALALVNPKIQNEYITIDDIGVRCFQGAALVWSYGWDDIAELRKSSRYKLPSIDVIVFDRFGKPEPYALDGQYFQTCKVARKAIDQYYKPTEASMN